MTTQTIAKRLMKLALNSGADEVQVIVAKGKSLSISVREGALETMDNSEGTDFGLRVIRNQKQACVSGSDHSDTALERMAIRAVEMAKAAPTDPYCGLASADELADVAQLPALDLKDPKASTKPEKLKDLALEMECAAQKVKGVSLVQSSGASYAKNSVYICTSNGFSAEYERSYSSLGCTAITGEGLNMQRDSAYETRVYFDDLPSTAEIGTKAGERTVAMQNPQRPKTGSYPILFDERISSSLIGHILAAVNGQAITRGSSWLKDSFGEIILPKEMSLTVSPHRKRIIGSRPFDGEGIATTPFQIIKDGALNSWVLDLSTARNLGLKTTASAGASFSSPPSPTSGNVTLTAGTHNKESLLREMGTGILVTQFIGSTINPNTGDYSRGAYGFWVENGEVQYPISEFTIAGNLHDMIKNFIPANDAKESSSSLVPSLLIEEMSIAGS